MLRGYQWWRLKLMASVMGTFVRDRMTDNTSECTPSVFLSMTPVKGNKDLELRAFYKRIFRMPTFNDLYYTDMGNKYLEPEYTTQYDVGITWKHAWAHNMLRRLELKADGYFNQVDNKIVAVPKGNSQYRWMMMNLGYVEILGAEFQFKTDWQFSPDWRLDFGGNYTYQKARDYSDPKDNDPVAGTWGGQIAYIPWHSASAMGTLTWLMKRNMDLHPGQLRAALVHPRPLPSLRPAPAPCATGGHTGGQQRLRPAIRRGAQLSHAGT